MENQSGNGLVSPFGDGKGATSADGPSSGAHDFLTDPESAAPKTGGRDFSQESRPQPADGQAKEISPDTIPAGGTLPFDGPVEDPHKPFKLGGGEG